MTEKDEQERREKAAGNGDSDPTQDHVPFEQSKLAKHLAMLRVRRKKTGGKAM